ncbi:MULTISPECIES: hypothetical protein [Thalassolituus]|jgi:hypothetical protein|uniref:hypothetical protein n=1 Tax=Thalassolituus TaxID=187492 RepID=UPI000C416FF0|nr:MULTISPECIES: hypothetical protein [Thalassolituus]MAX86429.1 hypothetical protein [Oceanospirillaceae bacterium]|tara:strand:+ start:1745 stop:2074 length:330 start_codon:yes stop_codon:yes gene_type:complete
MSRTIDDICLEIAKGISDQIDENWDQACIDVEFLGDYGSFEGEFIKNNESQSFEVADEAFDLFEEIYDITQENPNNKWNRAKFTLMPSGDFTTDFEWDQSLADEIEANS